MHSAADSGIGAQSLAYRIVFCRLLRCVGRDKGATRTSCAILAGYWRIYAGINHWLFLGKAASSNTQRRSMISVQTNDKRYVVLSSAIVVQDFR